MSRRLALDSSHLISWWNRRRKGRPIEQLTNEDVRGWARDLIDHHRTDVICTPVRIEFLCNTHGKEVLQRAREYLDEFRVIDRGEIKPEDWRLAERFAPMRGADVKCSRSLGDCLIAAVYRRLHYSLAPTPELDRDLVRRVQSPRGDDTS